jgi:hypothetical protein
VIVQFEQKVVVRVNDGRVENLFYDSVSTSA